MRRPLLARIAAFRVFFQTFDVAAKLFDFLAKVGEILGLADERLVQLLQVVLQMGQQHFERCETIVVHAYFAHEGYVFRGVGEFAVEF